MVKLHNQNIQSYEILESPLDIWTCLKKDPAEMMFTSNAQEVCMVEYGSWKNRSWSLKATRLKTFGNLFQYIWCEKLTRTKKILQCYNKQHLNVILHSHPYHAWYQNWNWFLWKPGLQKFITWSSQKYLPIHIFCMKKVFRMFILLNRFIEMALFCKHITLVDD